MKRFLICLIGLSILTGCAALATPALPPSNTPKPRITATPTAAPTAEPTAAPESVPEPLDEAEDEADAGESAGEELLQVGEPVGAQPSEAPASAEVPFATPLKKGDKGDDVRALQQMLIDHNYLDDKADGSFGNKTDKAVRAVQAEAGLEETGIADAATAEYLATHSAPFVAKKDNDILLTAVECDIADAHTLHVRVKNTGRNTIVSFKYKLYQCNGSKTSLGTFYGTRNTSTKRRRTEYWTEHGTLALLTTGEETEATRVLAEGWPISFSDGTSAQVTWFDKGVYARVVLYEFTTEDGKTHKTNQKMVCKFRED